MLISADELATNALKTSFLASSVGLSTAAAIQILGQISGEITHQREIRGENTMPQIPKIKKPKPWLTAPNSPNPQNLRKITYRKTAPKSTLQLLPSPVEENSNQQNHSEK